MFACIGGSKTIRERVSRRIAAKGSEYGETICTDEIIVVMGTDHQRAGKVLRSERGCILACEGDLLDRTDGEGIVPAYQKRGIDFSNDLSGVFNLVLWDGRAKRAVITNDKFGLNPLYYSVVDNGIVLSTRLSDFTELAGMKVKLDEVALREFACFHYTLGKRTFISNVSRLLPAARLTWENGSIAEENYWSVLPFIKGPPLDQAEVIHSFHPAFRKAVAGWVKGMNRDRIGILLSGGYDSRAILASLSDLGVRGCAYTWDNPEIKETRTGLELARAAGFEHRYLPYFPQDGEIDELVLEAEGSMDNLFPLFHIGRYNAVKMIAGEVDVLFSGQGEMIRATPIPNDFINLNAMAAADGRLPKGMARQGGYFAVNGSCDIENDIFLYDRYRDNSPMENLTLFLLYEAYRSDFGILRLAEGCLLPVAMPFMDPNIVALSLRNPHSIARLRSWDRDIFVTHENRKIYYQLIKCMEPGLLRIPLDRRYPPSWDNSFLGLLMTTAWGISRTFRQNRPRRRSPWERYVHRILSEEKTLSRPFLDRAKILKKIDEASAWTPRDGYLLENVARFELFYRRFFEGAV